MGLSAALQAACHDLFLPLNSCRWILPPPRYTSYFGRYPVLVCILLSLIFDVLKIGAFLAVVVEELVSQDHAPPYWKIHPILYILFDVPSEVIREYWFFIGMVTFLSRVPLISHSNNLSKDFVLAGAVNNALFLVPFVAKDISENFILHCTFTKVNSVLEISSSTCFLQGKNIERLSCLKKPFCAWSLSTNAISSNPWFTSSKECEKYL